MKAKEIDKQEIKAHNKRKNNAKGTQNSSRMDEKLKTETEMLLQMCGIQCNVPKFEGSKPLQYEGNSMQYRIHTQTIHQTT